MFKLGLFMRQNCLKRALIEPEHKPIASSLNFVDIKN